MDTVENKLHMEITIEDCPHYARSPLMHLRHSVAQMSCQPGSPLDGFTGHIIISCAMSEAHHDIFTSSFFNQLQSSVKFRSYSNIFYPAVGRFLKTIQHFNLRQA